MFNGIVCFYKVPLAVLLWQLTKFYFGDKLNSLEKCRRDVVTKCHFKILPILLHLHTDDS